jgi:hypothetical protein
MAREFGWSGSMFLPYIEGHFGKYPYLLFTPNSRCIDGNSSPRDETSDIDITTAFRLVCGLSTMCLPTLLDFTIHRHDVVVYNDRVEVGCVTVTQEQVEQIHQAILDKNK